MHIQVFFLATEGYKIVRVSREDSCAILSDSIDSERMNKNRTVMSDEL